MATSSVNIPHPVTRRVQMAQDNRNWMHAEMDASLEAFEEDLNNLRYVQAVRAIQHTALMTASPPGTTAITVQVQAQGAPPMQQGAPAVGVNAGNVEIVGDDPSSDLDDDSDDESPAFCPFRRFF